MAAGDGPGTLLGPEGLGTATAASAAVVMAPLVAWPLSRALGCVVGASSRMDRLTPDGLVRSLRGAGRDAAVRLSSVPPVS